MAVVRKYAYAWITVGFFLVSLALHWLFGWYAFADEAQQHGQSPDLSGYLVEMGRDTFENWQSEFLQLLWQVVGLAYFLYVGSPSSKENDDRIEAKVDALMRMVGGEKAQTIIGRLDEHYERHGGVEPHKHDQDYVHTAGLEAQIAPAGR
jgi:hypothetical protein